ncbi:uncharacterized protein SPAPADRAFT_58946 [Spathaspora passalidarum NRRL Y-27907]|uniref:Uncharacterized protein n=1 Tax=Spathaspora passalidarum (strain NRRL Y-27907 / 11-Y1) TaxID=619300 RepID=G3AEF5_SPAPN|nr:uncharacterized protein SPAPADRAFT_58946 [Spathaspora passalidarum NRRL Y-27907]EGW35743.1 hypothetical protein SPAPADRAFT_58946 [Spathaspora passalidarum NRRL Y-27907]
MIHETTINPGQGLGNSIKLGSPMFDIIKHLDKHKYRFRITFSEDKFYETPTLVTVVELGIRLTFNNHPDQYLDLIEVLNLDESADKKLLRLVYNGQSLNEFENEPEVTSLPLESTISKNSSSSTIMDSSPALSSTSSTNSTYQTLSSTGPTFKTIYNKIFGPTYPGKLNRVNKTYILSYPGISFKFTITDNSLLSLLDQEDDVHQILSKLLNWDNPHDVTCDSIALYKGNSWEDYKNNKRRPSTSSNELNKLAVNLNEGLVRIIKHDSEEVIKIGESTQQEVVNILGPPDEYFNKFDSRLLIHNHLTDEKESQDISHCKFHNYYKYGIDILYDLNNTKGNQNKMNTTVKKIIIHNGGIPEDLNFMKWNRCNWEIEREKEDDMPGFEINSTMYFDQLPDVFHQLNPVLLNRNESEFIDNDLDIIEMPDSVEPEEENPKVKTWGQSKLYGLNRCILEVINSNGCISTVTIY